MQFEQLISQFIEDVCAGKDNLTPLAYQRKLKYLQIYLDGRPITEVDRATMQNFVQYLLTRNTKRNGLNIIEGKLSPWTIKTVLTTTKHFTKWCYQKGILSQNPMEGVKIPKTPEPNPKAISPETVEQLVLAANSFGELWARPRNVMLIYLLRDTGGRRMGLSNADIDNLDLDEGRLEVVDKGNKNCILRLSENTVKAIRIWLPVRQSIPPLDHKILTSKKGYGIATGTINGILRNLAEYGGITTRSNHMRFAMHLLEIC